MNTLFLQVAADNANRMLEGGIVPAIVAVFGAMLIPFAFYLMTLQNALKAIAPANRKLQPGQVWMMFIPFFNIVFVFIAISRLNESMRLEAPGHRMDSNFRSTYTLGMVMSVLAVAYFVTMFLDPGGWISGTVGVAAFVCWIMHWMRVADFRRKVEATPVMAERSNAIFGSAPAY